MTENLIKIVDKSFGPVICVLLWLADKIIKRKPKGKNKFLIIMLWGIGSNVNSIPVIRALKENIMGVKIDVLAPKKNLDLFYGNKDINKTIGIDMHFFSLIKLVFKLRNNYNVIIDMEHWLNISSIISFFSGNKRIGFKNKFRSMLYTDTVRFNKHLHAVCNNLSLLSKLGINHKVDSLVRIRTKKENKLFVDCFLDSNKIGKNDIIIGLCPGSGNTVKARRWPKEYFISLANKILKSCHGQRKMRFILFGTKDETDLIGYIQNKLSTKTYNTIGFTLGQTVELINRLTIMVSNDTGPMHIATAQGIVTIGLFGPETPEIFAPFGKKNISFFKKLVCSPCIQIYKGKHIDCQNNICMKKIKVDDVFEAVKRIIYQ